MSTVTSRSPVTTLTTKVGDGININNNEMRKGKIFKIDKTLNKTVIAPPANNVLKTKFDDGKDTRLDSGEEKKLLKTSQVIEIHDKERNILKNLFDKMLAYKHLHLEENGIDEKEGILREYTLLIKKKYPHRQGNRRIPNGGGKNGSTSKRSITEGAGFTHDLDVCKHYNDNLIEMWSKLSKYIDSAEQSMPSKSVLHNISIMLRAYLDHVDPVSIHRQSSNTDTDTDEEKRTEIEDNLSPVIREIRDKVDVNTNSENDVENLTKLVIHAFRKLKGEETTECTARKEKEIASLIHFAYRQFLPKLNCDSNSNFNDVQIIDNLSTNTNRNINMKSEPNQLDVKSYTKFKRFAETDLNQLTSINLEYKPIFASLKNKNARHYVNLNTTPSNFNILSSIGTSKSKPIMTFYKTEISSRRKALNIEYCINVATDQLLSEIKFILMKYLQYNDCKKYGNTKIGIEKLIENTLGYQTPNDKIDDNASKYRELLRLLVNMQVRDLNRIFKTPTKEIQNNIINKQALEEFLRDINNLDALVNYRPHYNI